MCIDKERGNCKFYITAEETGGEPGCLDDGDITNPEEDRLYNYIEWREC